MIKSIIKNKYKILFFLTLASLVSSLVLLTENINVICTNEKSCETVQNSQYAFTFGIKNSLLGVFAFSLLAIILLLHISKPGHKKRMIIHLAIIFSAIVSLRFLYIQAFMLNAFCKYCLIIDICSIISLLIVILSSWEK